MVTIQNYLPRHGHSTDPGSATIKHKVSSEEVSKVNWWYINVMKRQALCVTCPPTIYTVTKSWLKTDLSSNYKFYPKGRFMRLEQQSTAQFWHVYQNNNKNLHLIQENLWQWIRVGNMWNRHYRYFTTEYWQLLNQCTDRFKNQQRLQRAKVLLLFIYFM